MAPQPVAPMAGSMMAAQTGMPARRIDTGLPQQGFQEGAMAGDPRAAYAASNAVTPGGPMPMGPGEVSNPYAQSPQQRMSRADIMAGTQLTGQQIAKEFTRKNNQGVNPTQGYGKGPAEYSPGDDSAAQLRKHAQQYRAGQGMLPPSETPALGSNVPGYNDPGAPQFAPITGQSGGGGPMGNTVAPVVPDKPSEPWYQDQLDAKKAADAAALKEQKKQARILARQNARNQPPAEEPVNGGYRRRNTDSNEGDGGDGSDGGGDE